MADVTAIIVPVFNAAAETQRCLAALEATTADHQPVIVVNDASTDPRIAKIMDKLAGHWVSVFNRKNIGFVASINLGISLASPADVIILNSDTQVTPGWLEAILNCAGSDEGIASITPFSNNAEIASIPKFCYSNPWPDNPKRWSAACEQSGPPQYPDIPTGIGFCMFLRRTCLDAIGSFDEAAFGRGYGEENDWCMRALAEGWRHVLCDDAFVAHEGSASFGPLGLRPGGQAMKTLLERHPDYMSLVSSFIDRDPIAQRRASINEHFRKLPK